MRPFNEDRTWGGKQKKEYILGKNGEKIYDKKKRQYKCKSVSSTDWNEQTKAEGWREAWAKSVNEVLERAGSEERIDHRSYERQGIDQIPTVHMGVAASQMERRGIKTERGNRNRIIEITNKQLRQLRARIKHLENWLKQEQQNTEPPTLADIIAKILDKPENQTAWQKERLRYAENVLVYLQENNVADLQHLHEIVKGMYSRQRNVGGNLRVTETRLKLLEEHIYQYGAYFKYKEFYDKYKQLKPKKQPQYYENNRMEISLFEMAKRHFDKHLDGEKKLPLKAWKDERDKLTAEKNALYRGYYKLKDDVQKAETVKRNVESILRMDRPQKQRPPQERGRDIGGR